MREIKFRGKSCIGNWVYGYLKKQMVGDKADVWAIQTEGKEMLHLPATRFKPAKDTLLYENIVAPNTVGQFTGLTDKNGKKIFEGDIFTSDYFDDTYNFEVVFSDGAFCGKHKSTGIYMLGFTNFDDNGEDLGYWCEEDYTSHIQIIGNIHDNPKLLS